MLPTDKLLLLTTLDGANCELSHGPRDLTPHPAIDYLIIPMGHLEMDGTVEVVEHELCIPICQDCQTGLQDGEWYLLYCIGCGASQWIIQELARRSYPFIVNPLRSCPKCQKIE